MIIFPCRIVPESLRWLMVKGRYTEARRHVKRLTRANKLPFPRNSFETIKNEVETHLKEKQTDKQHAFMDLLRTPVIRKRSLILFYLW